MYSFTYIYIYRKCACTLCTLHFLSAPTTEFPVTIVSSDHGRFIAPCIRPDRALRAVRCLLLACLLIMAISSLRAFGQTGLSGLSAVCCWSVHSLQLSTGYGRSCLLRSRTLSGPKMGSGEAWMAVGGSREGAWECCGALGSPLATQGGAQGAFWGPKGVPGSPQVALGVPGEPMGAPP